MTADDRVIVPSLLLSVIEQNNSPQLPNCLMAFVLAAHNQLMRLQRLPYCSNEKMYWVSS